MSLYIASIKSYCDRVVREVQQPKYRGQQVRDIFSSVFDCFGSKGVDELKDQLSRTYGQRNLTTIEYRRIKRQYNAWKLVHRGITSTAESHLKKSTGGVIGFSGNVLSGILGGFRKIVIFLSDVARALPDSGSSPYINSPYSGYPYGMPPYGGISYGASPFGISPYDNHFDPMMYSGLGGGIHQAVNATMHASESLSHHVQGWMKETNKPLH